MMQEKGKVPFKLVKTKVGFIHDLSFRRAPHSDNYDFCNYDELVPPFRSVSEGFYNG